MARMSQLTYTLKLTTLALFTFIVVIVTYLIVIGRMDYDEDILGSKITLIEPTYLDSQSVLHILPKSPYAETSTNIIIPTSWQQLNDQQFCTIHTGSSQQRLLEYIYKLQFTRDCNDPSTRFLIYDIYLENTRGLGASLFGWLNRYMTVAMQTNRTLLFHGTFDWTVDAPYCEGTNAMECYFVPLSHCDPMDILSQVNKKNPLEYYEGKNPTQCIFGENNPYNNLTACSQRVIYINSKRVRRPILKRAMDHFAREHFNMRVLEFETMIIMFLLRPQPNVSKIIYDKVKRSIEKSLEEDVTALVPSEYISLPIRASDKCKNIGGITHKHYTHKPEISCFTPFEYMSLMNALQYYSESTLQGVILTSEDSSFLQEVIDMMRYNNHSNVSHWRVILNTEDYSVGEGTTTYKTTKKRYNQSLAANIGTSLETDHIISALSSLVLQIHLETEYMAWLYDSSWTELMWNLLAILNCNVDKQKHIKNHNKCVTLLASGYLHKREHNTVEFSKDIWEKLHQENITTAQFYDKFGLWYDRDKFCHIRGTKLRVAK